jgi:hypothetical protein
MTVAENKAVISSFVEEVEPFPGQQQLNVGETWCETR